MRVAASFVRLPLPYRTSMRVERRTSSVGHRRGAGPRSDPRSSAGRARSGQRAASARGARRLRERSESVLLDLDELAFIDMSGLRAVRQPLKSLRRPRRLRRHGRLLPGPPPHRTGAACTDSYRSTRVRHDDHLIRGLATLTRFSGGRSATRERTHGDARLSDVREDAALLVSELVSNAMLHGIGSIGLRIDREANGLRVEVSDQGNVSVAPNPTPGAHGGWGLRIVNHLADDWGVLEGSTRVWFRVAGEPQRS